MPKTVAKPSPARTWPMVRINKNLVSAPDRQTGVHPWIFSGAVVTAPENLAPGDVVRVYDAGNTLLGYGHYNPLSSIRIRLFSSGADAPSDGFWEKKLACALELREKLTIASDAKRLVYAEADRLPGLIADQYGELVVIQTMTAGMDRIKITIAETLRKLTGCRAVIERNDSELRRLEGLEPSKGVLVGRLSDRGGKLPLMENQLNFSVDLLAGQKTGFYLDQRDSRATVAGLVRPGMRVLDAFSYTGAFSVYAASRGATELTLVDDSAEALAKAKVNLVLNGVDKTETQFHQGDAFTILRAFRDRGNKYDLVILDPPKFAPTAKDVRKAARGYKDINLLGMKMVADGGLFATFSCSSGLSRQGLREILLDAARDAGVYLQIIFQPGQPADHPVPLNFPEAEYLKGFIGRIIR